MLSKADATGSSKKRPENTSAAAGGCYAARKGLTARVSARCFDRGKGDLQYHSGVTVLGRLEFDKNDSTFFQRQRNFARPPRRCLSTPPADILAEAVAPTG